jgi:hypothetical protein
LEEVRESEPLVDRRDVWYGEGVYSPGARLAVAEDEVDALLAQRVVRIATPENAAAIDEAIDKGLPIPGLPPER